MNGQEILGNVAFYVSIAVVIGMAIMFSILFAIYGFYKIKHINYGHEDDKLEQTLRHRYKEIIERNSEEGLRTKEVTNKENVNEPDYVMVQNMKVVKTFTLVGTKEVEKPLQPTTVLEAIFEEKRKSKKWRVVSNVFFGIFYVLLLILLGFSIAFKVTNQQLYFGNSGLVAIYTGSMESVNDENEYIKEQGLEGAENRIMQYSLIGVDKVTSPDQMELYKIYGYRTPEGNLIVHRLIRIYTNPETNVTYYTFRGDANSESLSFELTITLDEIVGKYTGFQNYGLGVTLTYLQSTIGIVAMAAALIFLITYNITEDRIETNYYKRILLISQELDKKLGFVTSEVK